MTKVSRRGFLKSAAASGFVIVPRRVLGGRGHVAPSDRLNIAGIGCGGQGGGDLAQMEKENIVALCDADWEKAAKTFAKHPDAPKYKDFRVMLEKQKDIDAVTVGTPDHFHAVAAMAAIQLGKHVFVEKPLAHDVYETRRLVTAAREAKVATQMGNQGHAMESIRLLCEWIWDGAIGKVTEVHAWTPHPVWPQGMGRPADTPSVPSTLDWDVWLGPAPYRPYHPAYLPARWRGWLDFGTGGLGDMGCHIFDHIVWALKLGAPLSVEASSSVFSPKTLVWEKTPNTETFPQASMVTYKFPARPGFPPLTLTWYDGGLMPSDPPELEGGKLNPGGGILYVGKKGKLLQESAAPPRLLPASRHNDYGPPKETLTRVPHEAHEMNWVNTIRGTDQISSPLSYASHLTEIMLLGVASLRAGTKLHYDGEGMKVTNDSAANQFLTREYRSGWKLA
jgi:predicted dehydrogenase